MTTPTTPRKRMSEEQFTSQWMKAQEEIALLINRAVAVQTLMPSLYEGVLGKEAPAFEARFVWDREDEAAS